MSADGGDALVAHAGGCHCGAVRFAFDAPAHLVAWDCNCSVCAMRRNVHCIIPQARFRLVHGEDHLREYRFGTRIARHLFCAVCGITPFYRPRSNPDGFAITVACIDPGTVKSITTHYFDGRHWETAKAASGIEACSKVEAASTSTVTAAVRSP